MDVLHVTSCASNHYDPYPVPVVYRGNLRFAFTMNPALVALVMLLTVPDGGSSVGEVTRAELEVRQVSNEEYEQERSGLHDDISRMPQPMALLHAGCGT